MEDSSGVIQLQLEDQDLPAGEACYSPAELTEIRRGDRCPMCGKGVLDYDGLLNLSCSVCSFSLAGCFT